MDRDTSMTRSPKSCQERMLATLFLARSLAFRVLCPLTAISKVIACRCHRQLIDVDRVIALPNVGRYPTAFTSCGGHDVSKTGATIACRILALFTRG